MSDSELIVTIGAKDNTSTVIRKVNNELKYLDKEYELARKSSKNFETSQEGIKKKLETLSSKYEANRIKLDAYKKKLIEVQENLTKEKEKLEQLKVAQGDNAKAIEKTEANISKYNSQLHNTQNSIKLTEAEMRNLNSEINNTSLSLANFKVNQFKENMEQVGQKVQSAGEKIKDFGNGLSSAGTGLMKLSSPINALSVYSAKTAIDFEQAMADLQATSGATGDNFEALRLKAEELGRDTCKSANDSAAAMKYLALAGYDNKQILESTEPILKASVAWGADMATSADLATDSMSSLGLTTDQLTHYLDVCSQAQRSSNTSATQMMEAYIGCGGTLRALNIPLEESATILGRLADQGKKGSEAGVSLNSVLVNLTGGSSKAKGAMDELGVSAWDSAGNFIGLTNTLKLLKERLAACTQEQRTNFESAIGGKTQLDTLNMLLNGLGSQYDTLSGKINNCSGVTEEMYDIMNNTAQGNIEKLKSKLEALGIQLGEKLIPKVNNLIDKLSNLIDWFSNLDEGTQETIINMGLFTLAAGASLKAVGSLTKGIGSIVGTAGKGIEKFSKLIKVTEGVGAASTAASAGGVAKLGISLGTLGTAALGLVAAYAAVEGLIAVVNAAAELNNSTMIKSIEEMSALEVAIGKITGATMYSKEELESMGAVYSDWNENISKDTQESLDNISGKFRDLQYNIDLINLDGVVSEEEVNNISNRTNELCNNIIEAINNHKDPAYQAMYNLFIGDGAIDDAEQKLLDSISQSSNAQIGEVKRGQEEIQAIYVKAAEKHRAITQDEQSKISEIQKSWQEISLKNLTMSEEEYESAVSDFTQRCVAYNTEGLSEIVKAEKEAHNESLQAIKDKYEKSISIAQEQLPNLEGQAREACEARINQYKEAYNTELENENKLYEGKMNICNTKYPELMELINQYNGEELQRGEAHKQEMLEILKSQYDNLGSITESGWYTMYNTTNDSLQNIAVTVDETTGEITGIYDTFSGNVGAYTNDIASDVKNIADQHNVTNSQVKNALNDMANNTINASGQICDADGRVIGSLQGVKENADGTRCGILNLNGTPIQIQSNADGTIRDVQNVQNAIRNIPGSKTVTIKTLFEAIGNGVKSIFGFAKGTDNAPPGVAFVAEEGQELILDGRRALLTGNSGPQLYNFKGGEKVITAPETKKLLSKQVNGGFFNQNSSLSKQLINNTTNNYNNSYSNDFNMNAIAQMIAEATSAAVSNAMGNVTLKSNVYFNENALADRIGGKLAATRRRIR